MKVVTTGQRASGGGSHWRVLLPLERVWKNGVGDTSGLILSHVLSSSKPALSTAEGDRPKAVSKVEPTGRGAARQRVPASRRLFADPSLERVARCPRL